MSYRATLEQHAETVQDLEMSAPKRLQEATELFLAGRNHSAIYLAGLSAEMYLKTACFFLEGAKPADQIATYLTPVANKKYKPPFKTDFESGHGLWFWSQELLARRQRLGSRAAPRRFVQVLAALYNDWFIGMRYRPGSANVDEASAFIMNIEWIAHNHFLLRR